MWRELRHPHAEQKEAIEGEDLNKDGTIAKMPAKSLGQAVTQIVIADVSMSLDNVLAVAGAAHEHPWILVFGLALSVLLMGVAATFIARLLHRHRWIAYVGLLIILWVSLQMMWEGGLQIYDCNPSWFGAGPELGPHCPAFLQPASPAPH
jgi:YjbE family integral membrane protein